MGVFANVCYCYIGCLWVNCITVYCIVMRLHSISCSIRPILIGTNFCFQKRFLLVLVLTIFGGLHRFFVASDTGEIVHGVRFGKPIPPRVYAPKTGAYNGNATCIQFSPFLHDVFLSGYADGTVWCVFV